MLYRITALVHEQRHPFPLLEAISANGRCLVMAGAAYYWWYGDEPRTIGGVSDLDGTARQVAGRLKAATR